MASIKKADIVISTAGREKGNLFLVYEVEEREVLLIDGRYRKTENPKRKNTKHVRFVSRPETAVAHTLRSGGRIQNSDVRKALAACAAAQTPAYEV